VPAAFGPEAKCSAGVGNDIGLLNGPRGFAEMGACGVSRRAPKRVERATFPVCALGWLRGLDLNQRPLGYEPNELPDCSTPRKHYIGRSPYWQ
jgi:hypothetical protein